MKMNQAPCVGECSKFQAVRPESGTRLQAGQYLCWNCGIWLAPREAHADGGPSPDAGGPYCNCCNHTVCTPRPGSGQGIDLGYFDKPRAKMLQKIVQHLTAGEDKSSITGFVNSIQGDDLLVMDARSEFDMLLYEMVDLAYTLDPPNKLSMLLELETVRKKIGHVPKRSEMEEHSAIPVLAYEGEFQSWDRLLDMLGYDPSPEHEKPEEPAKQVHLAPPPGGPAGMTVDEMQSAVNRALQDEPEILGLFEKLSRNMPDFDRDELKSIARSLHGD